MGSPNSPWLKRVLIPFWAIRGLFMAILIIIFALGIGILADDAPGEYIAIWAVFLGLFIFCLVLDIITIVKFARNHLSPRLFLIFNVIQTTFWTVVFVLEIVGAASTRSGVGGIILTVIVFATYVGLLIYGSVVFHRHRKAGNRGAYQPTPDQQADTAYTGGPAYQMYPPQQQQPQPHQQPQQMPVYGQAANYYGGQEQGQVQPQHYGYAGQPVVTELPGEVK
ncbi:hypothetical protein BDY21DRAFT_370702 [Lineolata rhizophorae]|uniref:MARVEL domain-containing protein n=1 Tax=Lineolata rhizophorae TaxID=578093 RepID=A0A6A6P3X3_9PEZI|nr:hypothetical protein BDY21DRAFT_370702 [Lineolata rhizophorae]